MFIKYKSKSETLIDRMNQKYYPTNVLCMIKTQTGIDDLNEFEYQCFLPSNTFNEKIFFIIWMWLLFLIISNLVSLVQWIYFIVFWRNCLKQRFSSFNLNSDLFNEFCKYLSIDGFFIVILVECNTSLRESRGILNELLQTMRTRQSCQNENDPLRLVLGGFGIN
jgi:hypothetical protein